MKRKTFLLACLLIFLTVPQVQIPENYCSGQRLTLERQAPEPEPSQPTRLTGSAARAVEALSARRQTLLANLAPPKAPVHKINEPADLIELVPVLRDIKRMIPKQFRLANHKCTASLSEIKIEHQFDDVVSRVMPKNSIITLSVTGPLANLVKTSVDLPLFYKASGGIKRGWIRYPAGNYTVTLNRDVASADQAILLKAQTRF